MAATPLNELKRLGNNLQDAPFVCGGSVDPLRRGAQTDGTAVWYRNPQGQLCALSFPPPDTNDIERLVSACAPATFGRGDQDVLDPTYRQAVKLDPSQFTTSFNLAEFPILAEVQRVIGGDVGSIRAILHKLNVYGPGGFFKAHRDTPRSSQCVGTIVVCLPTAFTGGEFVVQSGDGSFSHTFDWGSTTTNGKIQWCAFYSDCEHEVLPVRDGHRVTLTYVLEHVPLESPTRTSTRPFTAFGERLAALLEDPTFAPDGTKLGFGLVHQYVVSDDVLTGEQEEAVVSGMHATVPLMKGADRVLKETLDSLGLQYAFVPVYASDGYNESPKSRGYAEEDEEGYFESTTYCGRPVPTPTEWRFPFPTEGHPQGAWRGDGERWLYVSDWGSYMRPADGLDYGPHGGLDFTQLTLYRSLEVVWVVRPSNFPYLKTSITYGNEHCLGHYYAAACLLVYVPPSGKRGACVADRPPKRKLSLDS